MCSGDEAPVQVSHGLGSCGAASRGSDGTPSSTLLRVDASARGQTASQQSLQGGRDWEWGPSGSSLTSVRSRELGQNFLQNRRTARRVAHLAGGDPGLLCVDLGAGNGSITDAALLRSGPILAIEMDARLAQRLRQRFEAEPRVTVVEADLAAAEPPSVPFVIAANPPFNLSTFLVRRWFAAENFQSGALIVERPFAGRVSGGFGATKLSVSLGAYLEMSVPFDVRPAEFNPRPRVDAAILTASRREDAPVPWAERAAYWTLVNYLFERGRHTVGEAVEQLALPGVPNAVRRLPIREIALEDAVELYRQVSAVERCRALLDRFESSLPVSRRMALGDLIPEGSRPAQTHRRGGSSRR